MGALSIFARASQGILSLMGEDAFLRDTVPCRVHIEHGVQVIGHEDGMTVERSVATLAKSLDPKPGDRISGHPEGGYILDFKLQDSGHNVRYVVRKAPAVQP